MSAANSNTPLAAARVAPSQGTPAGARQSTAAPDFGALLVATAAGDQIAFKALYDATSPKLFGIALLLLKRRDAAEDALQEAYLRIWSKARLYDPERGPPMPWLVQILRNVAIDRYHRDRVTHEDITEHADALAATAATLNERTDLMRCIGTLSKSQLKVVLLGFLHGFTHDEIAASMRVPAGTVKSWARRGAARLKTCLEQ
ncbi:MAG: sigma-70 family RNA polymerase sigma factor [Rhodoplanes sp.]|uniref:sigma-70 family RNA polymerase sigma factor n=1 Tax=Rhodoplanes sp. TaxID=1968906 RepID=UPI0017EBE60E|nr:sigma-70 family RNA polymerase sigma factor [Rhodoplanes sp.]NVO16521.1 sigma-70 family RNA polymerase sigma factor [Rhodoplanes sp.]